MFQTISVGRDFRLPMLAFATVAQKSFNSKFIYCKNTFSDWKFYVTLTNAPTNADIGSLNFLQTLFDKYLDHMLVRFKQNHNVQNIGKNWLTILRKY